MGLLECAVENVEEPRQSCMGFVPSKESPAKVRETVGGGYLNPRSLQRCAELARQHFEHGVVVPTTVHSDQL